MPYSNVEQIPIIINVVKSFHPRKILDVGCGIGIYGLLIRVFLELYDDAENFLSRLLNQKWEIELHGIEGYSPYIDLIPSWVYDHIWNEDVFSVLPSIQDGEYDVSLAVAILEHFSKEDGYVFLDELKRISNIVVVSVPRVWGEQIVPENPLENHRSHWTSEDFKHCGFTRFLPSERSTIAIFGSENGEIEQQVKNPAEKTSGIFPFAKLKKRLFFKR